MKSVAVIPAYNEADHIGDVVEGVESTECVDRTIVVDDCSTDATVSHADTAGAFVVENHVQRNYGGAIKRGYTEALNFGAEIVYRLDADGQHNPENIKRMAEVLRTPDCQYVAGNRFADPSYRHSMPLDRIFGNRVVSKITNLRTGVRFTDPPCGFRAMDARYLRWTPYHRFSNDFRIGVEEVLAFLYLGAGFREVPVDCIYAEEESTLSYYDGLKFLVPSVTWWNSTKRFDCRIDSKEKRVSEKDPE